VVTLGESPEKKMRKMRGHQHKHKHKHKQKQRNQSKAKQSEAKAKAESERSCLGVDEEPFLIAEQPPSLATVLVEEGVEEGEAGDTEVEEGEVDTTSPTWWSLMFENQNLRLVFHGWIRKVLVSSDVDVDSDVASASDD